MAQERAKESPHMYQFNEHAIEYFDFNGRLYVHGCRCGMDVFIFDFLTEEKQRVLSYYKQTQDELNASDINQG